jgi:hypothetical protein
MEVRGYIPNNIVRERALKTARASCSLEITDELRSHPTLALRSGGVAPRQLEEAVRQALQDAFPEAARDIMVKARANGEVTLTGSIPSWEDKLAVSHCLRKVRGCSAVVNQLKIPTIIQEGQKLTRVTSDGQQMIPAGFAEDLPAGSYSPMMGSHGMATVNGMRPPVHRGPGGTMVDSHWVPTRGQKSGSVSPYSPYPSVAVGKMTPVNWRKLAKPATPAQDSSGESEAQTEETVSQPAGRYNGGASVREMETTTGQERASTWESGVAEEPGSPPARARVKPASHQEAVETENDIDLSPAKMPRQRPAAKAVEKECTTGCPSKAKGSSYEQSFETDNNLVLPPVSSTKVGCKGSACGAGATAAEPESRKSESVISEKPYESTGVMVFDDAEPTDEAAGPSTTASVPERMKACIEKACAGGAWDVEVVVRSAHSLKVTLKVKDTTTGARLSQKILHLPELGPYQVSLEVKIVP